MNDAAEAPRIESAILFYLTVAIVSCVIGLAVGAVVFVASPKPAHLLLEIGRAHV